MLGDMNWGCLSFIILFPAGIFIWAAGERRRRAAMPPEELKNLEDEERYGEINEPVECIYCHQKNCVRTITELREGDLDNVTPYVHSRIAIGLAVKEALIGEEFVKAHCMNCGSHWILPPQKES